MDATHRRRTAVRLGWLLLGLWTIAFVGAFVAFALTPSTDFGHTAGLNRGIVFFGWQVVAGILALLALVLRGSLPRRSVMRRLMIVPASVLLALILAAVLLIFWANAQRPGTPLKPLNPQRAPVTAPASKSPASPG